jgi:hypothetical protein
MIESTEIELPKNELRVRKGKLYFLNDFRAGLSCGECKSLRVQPLTIVARDLEGDFTVCCYRCIDCDSMWHQPGSEESFSRYCQDDV